MHKHAALHASFVRSKPRRAGRLVANCNRLLISELGRSLSFHADDLASLVSCGTPHRPLPRLVCHRRQGTHHDRHSEFPKFLGSCGCSWLSSFNFFCGFAQQAPLLRVHIGSLHGLAHPGVVDHTFFQAAQQHQHQGEAPRCSLHLDFIFVIWAPM